MQTKLTTISKATIYLMIMAVLSVCGILLPELAREEAVGKVNPPSALPYLLYAWVLAAPIFVALYQMTHIVNFIDRKQAFADRSVKALRAIQYCAVVFISFVLLGAGTLIVIGKQAGEDVTPVVTLTVVGIVVAGVIATFAAVLKRLLQDAIQLQSDHDLTI